MHQWVEPQRHTVVVVVVVCVDALAMRNIKIFGDVFYNFIYHQ